MLFADCAEYDAERQHRDKKKDKKVVNSFDISLCSGNLWISGFYNRGEISINLVRPKSQCFDMCNIPVL